MVAVAETVDGAKGPLKMGPDGHRLRACGAVRISEEGQSEYSTHIQKAAIVKRAHADGYAMDLEDIYEDPARGHNVLRRGYQQILAGVRAKRYHAIYCIALDRWGRDSLERQIRGRELDKLGVPVISLTQGIDEPGTIRVIRAQMDEEEAKKIALRVMPGRRAGAMAGVHQARAPYGYRRAYPSWDGRGRRPPGVLVPLEPQASEIRTMFARYDTGQWSTRDLAEDLNKRDIWSPDDNLKRRKGKSVEPSKRVPWSTSSVAAILKNVTYVGDVSYDQRPGRGHYIQTPSGPPVVVEDKHEPLISRDLFQRVQQRLAEARGSRSVARRTPHTHVLAGLFQCHACGGTMIPSAGNPVRNRQGHLRCVTRAEGHVTAHGTPCRASGYRLDLATDALLAEVSRLRGRPWTSERERLLSSVADNAAAAAAVDRQIAQARESMKKAHRRFMVEITEPTDADREAFAEIRSELAAEINRLEAEKAALQADADSLPRLKALHSRLRKVEMRDFVQRLRRLGERGEPEMRDLLVLLVQSATVIDRYPETRSVWLKVEVEWTDDVRRLLDAGLLWLDEPSPDAAKPTVMLTPAEIDREARTRAAQRERQHRYQVRRAEAKNAAADS